MGEWTRVIEDENRLYVDLDGYETTADGDDLLGAVHAGLARLDPGFAVVVDYRGYRPASPAAIARFDRVRRAIAEAEAAATVSVLPESASGRPHFEAAGANGARQAIATAESVEGATTLLDRRRGRAT